MSFADDDDLPDLNDPLERLLEGARQHGLQSEPDHEIGDLQDVLRFCWTLLTPEQRQQVVAEFKERVDEWIER